MKYYLIVLFESIFIGLLLSGGNLAGDIEREQLSLEQKDENNISKVFQDPENSELRSLLKPNISTTIQTGTDGVTVEPYKLKTNSKGLREEPFRTEKPENLKRIVFIGDSFTMGWGVNRSEIYTERFESRIKRKEPRTQVINTGIAGYGVKDYYEMLRYKAIDYEPDLVVISLQYGDLLGLETSSEIRKIAESEDVNSTNVSRKIRRIAESNKGSKRAETAAERAREIKAEYVESIKPEDSKFTEYIPKIVDLAQKEDFRLAFYLYRPHSSKKVKFFENHTEGSKSGLITAPEKFSRYANRKYTLNRKDRHYNSLGHKWLAEKLYREYRDRNLTSKDRKNPIQEKLFSKKFILQKVSVLQRRYLLPEPIKSR